MNQDTNQNMNQEKKARKRYSEEFKIEALELAAKTSVASASKELGIYESQLYNWRSAKNKKTTVSKQTNTPVTKNTLVAENILVAENARLKRQLVTQAEELEILKKAVIYFAKAQN